MALELRFLGPPAIHVDGHPASLHHRRAVLLLALLALRAGRPMERTMVAELIWPDREAEEAAVNLRRALADLRSVLGSEAPRVVAPDRRTLRLDGDCDVRQFDDATHRFDRGADPADGLAALELYLGPLLEGWTDECVESERRYRAEAAARIAETLARMTLDAGETTKALRLLDRAEAISPHRESTLRLRLDAHLARGDGTAARVAFDEFARRLEHDFGIAPSPETLLAAERLRMVSSPPSRPRTAWPLIGREAELAQLRRELSIGGLVTVVGPGGVGKTRLALAATEDDKGSFVDLARFASGTPLERLARAVDVPSDPLLLDNAEHLLPAIALVAEAAIRAGRTVLVTSRSPLGVSGERFVRLAPLEPADAARLFSSRAGALRPREARDPTQIDRVCRRLEGLPLALELAAARLRMMSLSDLQARLETGGGLAFLTGSTDLPERQRTLTQTVNWSLSLLSERARRALMRLATFRGGFTLEAAESVLDTGAIDALTELADQSLISMDDSEPLRYRMLETIRAAVPGEAEGGRALGQWAAEFSEQAYEGLWHGDAAAWLSRLEAEWSNLRAGVEEGEAADAGRIVESIDAVWWRTGRFREGIAWREAARRRAEAAGDAKAAARHALIVEQFRRRLGEPNRARAAFREHVEACLSVGDRTTASYFLHSLGFIQRDDGDLTGAAATMREGLALAERIGEPGLIAYAWRGIAAVDLAAGRLPEATSLLQRAAAQFRQERLMAQETMTSAWLAEALLEGGDASGAAAVAEIALTEAQSQRSDAVEMSAELVAGRAAVELGNLDEAERHLSRAADLAELHDSPEGRAQIASASSALARARGTANPRFVLNVLREPASAYLPYPTLLPLVEEGTRALDAIGAPGPARRLETEVGAARHDAQRGVWSASLMVTRVLAAFPVATIRAGENSTKP